MLDALQHSLGGYREYRVPVDLRDVADVIWCYSRPEGAPAIPGRGHRVLPEAGVSLCFWTHRDARGRVSDPRVMFIGPAPSVHFFSPYSGEHLEAIRIKPEWSRDLLGIDPGEHHDAMSALPESPRLRDALTRSRSSVEALAILANALRERRAAAHVERATAVAHEAMEHVRAASGAIGQLPRRVGVSERQLRRAVVATTGLTAKHAQRIMRINRAVFAADRVADPDWASIALDCGFYDQPHLIDAMRELTGATPSALHAERRVQLA